jgi:purine-nucleoside phosphorylase
MSYEQLTSAAAAIAKATGRDEHRVAAVLGSGLSDYGASLPGAVEVPYAAIPGFPVPQVEGHSGSLFSADMDGVPLLVLAGRVHAYEGLPMEDVVFGVRCAALCGAETVVLTNAAGSVDEALRPGDLVTISDHLNLTGLNPLVGGNDDRLGTRFPDLTDLYADRLRQLARVVATEIDISLGEGVYAWLLGPSYETPAEIRMARTLGADLVGMSTVPEAIALRHMGVGVLGLSLVTNLAAGISERPLTHDEVRDTAERTRETVTTLMNRLLPRLGQDA